MSAIQWDEVFYSRQVGDIIFYHRTGTPHSTVPGMDFTALCILHSIPPCGWISTVFGGGVWSKVLGSLKSTMYSEVILNSQIAGYAVQASPELQLKWMCSSENRNAWHKWCEIILSYCLVLRQASNYIQMRKITFLQIIKSLSHKTSLDIPWHVA